MWLYSFREEELRLNEPINLYKDTIVYEFENQTVNLESKIRIQWLPIPRLVFEIENDLVLGSELKEIKFKLKDGRLVEGSITNISSKSQQGIIKKCEIVKNDDNNQNKPTKKAIFLIPNFKILVGGFINKYEEQNKTTYSHRLKIHLGEWIIIIDALKNIKQTTEELKKNSGFAITHIGEVKKADNSYFEYQEAYNLLEAITFYLWFATGRRTSPLLLTGFDDTESKIWEVWESPAQAPYTSCRSWLDEYSQQDQFEKPIPEFLKLWSSEDWKDILQQVIHLYVEANTSLLVEKSIILSQSALELLSSAILELPDKTSASGFIKDLVNWANIPTEFNLLPKRFNRLQEMVEKSPQKESWKDKIGRAHV